MRELGSISRWTRYRLVAGDAVPDVDVVFVGTERGLEARIVPARGYELGGRVSERQWKDVVGVLLVQRDALDNAYLDEWAQALGLDQLLAVARREAAAR